MAIVGGLEEQDSLALQPVLGPSIGTGTDGELEAAMLEAAARKALAASVDCSREMSLSAMVAARESLGEVRACRVLKGSTSVMKTLQSNRLSNLDLVTESFTLMTEILRVPWDRSVQSSSNLALVMGV